MVAYMRSLIFGKIRECSWKKRVVILTLCPLHLGGQQTPNPQKVPWSLRPPRGGWCVGFSEWTSVVWTWSKPVSVQGLHFRADISVTGDGASRASPPRSSILHVYPDWLARSNFSCGLLLSHRKANVNRGFRSRGSNTHSFVFWTSQSLHRTTEHTQEDIWYYAVVHWPGYQMCSQWRCEREYLVVCRPNSVSCAWCFSSKLLRDLQKGESELKPVAGVHGMLLFSWGCEASISGVFISSHTLLLCLFIWGLLIWHVNLIVQRTLKHFNPSSGISHKHLGSISQQE